MHRVNDPVLGAKNILDGQIHEENSFTVADYIARDREIGGTRSAYGPFGLPLTGDTSIAFGEGGTSGICPAGATNPIEFIVREP